MPFIDSKVTVKMSDSQKEQIKTKLGQEENIVDHCGCDHNRRNDSCSILVERKRRAKKRVCVYACAGGTYLFGWGQYGDFL